VRRARDGSWHKRRHRGAFPLSSAAAAQPQQRSRRSTVRRTAVTVAQSQNRSHSGAERSRSSAVAAAQSQKCRRSTVAEPQPQWRSRRTWRRQSQQRSRSAVAAQSQWRSPVVVAGRRRSLRGSPLQRPSVCLPEPAPWSSAARLTSQFNDVKHGRQHMAVSTSPLKSNFSNEVTTFPIGQASVEHCEPGLNGQLC
jgi:hypothetical protein